MSLKPCPFCLSTDIRPVVDEMADGSVHSYCSCSNCGSRGPVVVSARAACAVWNNTTSPSVVTPRILRTWPGPHLRVLS